MTQPSIIYFDNAATTGKKPDAVKEAICDCLEHANANPGRSGHSLSVKAAEIIYATREVIGEFFNFPRTENIVLTRNATEALNIALYGTLEPGDEVVTTSMEHNSVMRPLNHLESKGMIKVKIVQADADGSVSPQLIREAITEIARPRPSCSNGTGFIRRGKAVKTIPTAASKIMPPSKPLEKYSALE